MIYRASKVAEYAGTVGSLDGFSDAYSISAWALDAAKWNAASGLIEGNSYGMISGQTNITRGETAAVILRLLQNAKLVDVRTEA